MKSETLGVKISEEMAADLDAFAETNFQQTCVKCKGSGQTSTGSCPRCGGVGHGANRSEAARFLLHLALGQSTSPQTIAIIAAYTEVRAKFFSIVASTAHRMEAGFREEVVAAVKDLQTRTPRKRT